MFYFKDAPPASLSEIDPNQLMKVQEFQRSIKEMGMIRFFKTRDEFARLMRMHLSQKVQEWSRRTSLSNTPAHQIIDQTTKEIAFSPVFTEEEEEGFLDLVERGLTAWRSLHIHVIGLVQL
jgi:hypothetical protein